MGAGQLFDQMVIESGGDYARGFQVFVSDDGTNWGTAIATGAGTTATTSISFVPQTKRHVRIMQTGTATAWWSIYEINLWNNGGNPPP